MKLTQRVGLAGRGGSPNRQRAIEVNCPYLYVGPVANFWKCGSLQSGSNMRSSRSERRSTDSQHAFIRCRRNSVRHRRVLTYSHTIDMVFHTKTTLNIDDTVMARLRQEAARQRKTMSELVEAGLRLLFQSSQRVKKKKLRPLPTFNSGGFLVDVADRNALYDVLDREHDDLYPLTSWFQPHVIAKYWRQCLRNCRISKAASCTMYTRPCSCASTASARSTPVTPIFTGFRFYG